ncbi:MAG: [Fe-Fe] hydrogenase large subunit C-terminal domain-containing protein [Clostridia bacterium]
MDILKNSNHNTTYKVYAIVAPAIVSQFRQSKFGQVVSGIKALGFAGVYEAALGADITIYREAKEFKEKKILTTSCCPSFVAYVEKYFPELSQYISTSPSPMVETAMLLKRKDANIKTIFIGPCTSKKLEYKLDKTQGAIDSVISFEELQAFFDARNIELESLEETPIDDASFYGRVFAKCGGITQDIKNVASKFGVDNISPVAMSGISECKVNLLKLKLGKSADNFFEGMACDGGCINGALCLHHDIKSLAMVDNFSKTSSKDIDDSVNTYKNSLENNK